MVEYSTLFGLAQTLAIIVGVIIAVMELRHMRRARDTEVETRQAQLFMQIYDRFNETEFTTQWNEIMYQWTWKDFEDWWQKYGPEAKENASFISVQRYYEGVGVLVRKRLIDLNLVGELMSSYMIRFWEHMEPVMKGVRERLNWPQLFRACEYLYNELKKLEQLSPAT